MRYLCIILAILTLPCLAQTTKKKKKLPYEFPFDSSIEEMYLTVRINLVILQRSDGTGNFDEKNEEHRAVLNEMKWMFNEIFSNNRSYLDTGCYSGKYEVSADSKLRFKIDEMFIKNTHYWDNTDQALCPDKQNWYLDHLDDSINAIPGRKPSINIYYTESSRFYKALVLDKNCSDSLKVPKGACSMWPSDKYDYMRIHIPNYFLKYNSMKNCVANSAKYNFVDWPGVRWWFLDWYSKTTAHELGHALGLAHRNKCAENLMHVGTYGIFLSADEIRLMKQNLLTKNIRRYIEE